MRTNRSLVIASVVILCGLAVLPFACIVRVPDGSVGLPMRSGRPSGPLQAPGFHLASPLERTIFLPGQPYPHRGEARLISSEGAAVAVPFDVVLNFGAAEGEALASVADRMSRGEDLSRAIDHAIRGRPEESPTETIASFVRELGGLEGTLRVGQPRAITAAPNPVRDAWRGAPYPVVLIGVDSADWDLIDPLIESGDLPNIAGLRARGAWGTLASMTPTLSPILWTTIATGRPPEEHGILDFLMKDAEGREVPISRTFRRVKALWNIASDVGLRTLTVGWWATWPAEPVDGVVVSDRVAYTLFDLPLDAAQPGLVYPPGLLDTISALRIEDEDITYEDVRSIVSISRARFDRARAALEGPGGWSDPVAHLIRILAGTLTYHRCALTMLEKEAPGLTLVYYEGLDEVNHRFAHYLPPAMGLVASADADERAAFAGAIPAFYRFQDRLIGEIVAAADPNAVILIVSDHGFANGRERPTDAPPDIEGQPGLWHALEGVAILAGPGVTAGPMEGIGLLDVTPTVLTILGLPVAADMPGHPFPGIRSPRETGVAVAGYDALGEPVGPAGAGGSSPQDAEMIARLRALGYIDSGESMSSSGTATSHVNAGHIFLRKGDLDRAEQEFLAARDLAPGFDQAHLGLAQVAVDRGRPVDAIAPLEAALRLPDPRPALLIRAARVYARAGRAGQGVTFLQSLVLEGRADAFRLAAVGMLHEALGETPEALTAYRAALDRDPSVVPAMRRLYALLRDRDPEGLAGTLARSLQVEPQAAATRAANWLALTRERQGRIEEAIGILTEAVDRDPGDLQTLTNLGSMLVRADRAGDGLPYLERARDQQPESHEILVNLIVAHGKLDDRSGARAIFDRARGSARPEELPSLLNAIAYACYLTRDAEDASRYLDESLALDPNQPDALALREAVRRGAL